jgi:hypothetical protein
MSSGIRLFYNFLWSGLTYFRVSLEHPNQLYPSAPHGPVQSEVVVLVKDVFLLLNTKMRNSLAYLRKKYFEAEGIYVKLYTTAKPPLLVNVTHHRLWLAGVIEHSFYSVEKSVLDPGTCYTWN